MELKDKLPAGKNAYSADLFFYCLNLSSEKIWLSEDLCLATGLSRDRSGWLNYDKWLELVHPEDREKAHLLARQSELKKHYSINYRLQIRTRAFQPIEDSGVMIEDDQMGVSHFLGFISFISNLSQSQKIQQALYQIAQLTVESENLPELLRTIHQIIKNLMTAENFYIAIYDKETGLLSFPYYVDEYDSPPPPQPKGRGLTEYVLATGEPLLASPEVFARLEATGQVESIGAPSVDWLGLPLKAKDEIFGVMVVQSYTEGLRYNEEHLKMLSFVANQAALVIKNNLAEEARRETEKLLTDSFTSIQDGISILDLEMNIIRVNPAMENWYAHALPLVGKKCYAAYHGKENFCQPCPSLKTLRTMAPASEIVPKTGKGGEIAGWLELFTFPLIDLKSGKLKGIIEYVRDISDKKKAEDALLSSLKEKEILLKEIHHRVKNNMQVISSLLSLQAEYLKDPEAQLALKECQSRIHSMALAHEKLYREKDLSSIDFQDYTEKLVVHLFQIFNIGAENISFSTKIISPRLTVELAIPLGLIITELITNSLRHAFPSGSPGRVEVSLVQDKNGLILQVKDNGRGFKPSASSRFGLEIVRLLSTQIGGHFTLESLPKKGTRAEVQFPLPGLISEKK
jgi:two-component sensor histidine kinase/PAS domain-containing protein